MKKSEVEGKINKREFLVRKSRVGQIYVKPTEGLPGAHGRIAKEATAATRCAAMEEGEYEYFRP